MGTDLGTASPQAAGQSRRVLQLFWIALALRVAIALVIHFGVSDPFLFAPDQLTYHERGRFIADRWSQDIPLAYSILPPSGPQGYFYIVAVLYYAFGPYPLIPKLVNCLVGAVTIPAVHDLALRMGASPAAAVRAATYATWFPSLILWSALNIRDPWLILLIVLICRAALVLQARPSLGPLVVLAAGTLALVQFRAYLLFAVAGPVLVSFLAQRSRNLVRNVVLGSLAAVAVIYADQAAGQNRKGRFLDFQEVNEMRYFNALGAASGFEQADISTPGKALVFLPQGLALFLLAPFPWMVASVRQVLAVPETLFFYWLIPSMLRGIRELVRHHLRTSLMALLITASLTFGYALGEGNAGTAYRHRAQMLSFFLIFAAVGLESRRRVVAVMVARPTSPSAA
jgi:hypothetical protein